MYIIIHNKREKPSFCNEGPLWDTVDTNVQYNPGYIQK